MQRARRRDGSDLRRELLAVTRDQLEAMGDPAAVTISSIVSAARCTPPSLYHYWPTRDALFAEASRSGWEDFVASQQDAIAGLEDPLERSARADGPIGTLPASGPPCSACSSSNRGVGTPPTPNSPASSAMSRRRWPGACYVRGTPTPSR